LGMRVVYAGDKARRPIEREHLEGDGGALA
jgi:hypothetical protein